MANIDQVKQDTELVIQQNQAIQQSLRNIAANLEALTIQVGTFTEGVTRLEIQLERVVKTTETQAETAQIQAESVRQLVDLVKGVVNQSSL